MILSKAAPQTLEAWSSRFGLVEEFAASKEAEHAATPRLLKPLECPSCRPRSPRGSEELLWGRIARPGLERLIRYYAGGRLALKRLHGPVGIGALASPEARLVYRLPEPDVHGRQELRLTHFGLLERLALLATSPDTDTNVPVRLASYGVEYDGRRQSGDGGT